MGKSLQSGKKKLIDMARFCPKCDTKLKMILAAPRANPNKKVRPQYFCEKCNAVYSKGEAKSFRKEPVYKG